MTDGADPVFDPLDGYPLDDLLDAVDRRCHAMFVVALPRRADGDGGEGVCVFDRTEWHDYRVLDLIGAVELGRAKLLRRAQEAAGPTSVPRDDVDE